MITQRETARTRYGQRIADATVGRLSRYYRTLKHLEDNLGACGWQLSDEQMQHLEETSRMKPGYPESFIVDSLRRK